jgi:hypothetical protein
MYCMMFRFVIYVVGRVCLSFKLTESQIQNAMYQLKAGSKAVCLKHFEIAPPRPAAFALGSTAGQEAKSYRRTKEAT